MRKLSLPDDPKYIDPFLKRILESIESIVIYLKTQVEKDLKAIGYSTEKILYILPLASDVRNGSHDTDLYS